MTRLRQGFTLIELIVVMLVIGVLVAVAIPRFTKPRERAYFSAMKADLKNLVSAQEIYYSAASGYSYAPALADLDGFSPSSGVTIDLVDATRTGWSATTRHAGLQTTQTCAVFYGEAAALTPAATPGVIACGGEN